MTSTSSTESDSPATAPKPAIERERTSYLSGRWIPHSSMRIAVDDVGFRQGVTVVERMRTYSGRIFALDAHLDRWRHSVVTLGIDAVLPIAQVKSLLPELLAKNAALLRSEGDVGVTMFVTPGELGGSEPTLGLHLSRLNHAQNESRRREGQPLVVTDVKQPGVDCWPRSIKVRSRIHYYRADAIARDRHSHAVGVLIDDDGSVTETSIANLAIVVDGQIVSPPSDRVLGGITQSVVESLASVAAISWAKRPISVEQFSRADEILMMGTDTGIWFASFVDGDPIGDAAPGQVYLRLRQCFDQYVSG